VPPTSVGALAPDTWDSGDCDTSYRRWPDTRNAGKHRDVPAEGGSTAALNGTKGFELLKIKARSIPIQEAIALHP